MVSAYAICSMTYCICVFPDLVCYRKDNINWQNCCGTIKTQSIRYFHGVLMPPPSRPTASSEQIGCFSQADRPLPSSRTAASSEQNGCSLPPGLQAAFTWTADDLHLDCRRPPPERQTEPSWTVARRYGFIRIIIPVKVCLLSGYIFIFFCLYFIFTFLHCRCKKCKFLFFYFYNLHPSKRLF